MLEELATLCQLLEAPHVRQERLLKEPVHNLGDARLLLRLFKSYILEAPQVLVEVDLVDADAPVKILIRVRELHDLVVSPNLLLDLLLRGGLVPVFSFNDV